MSYNDKQWTLEEKMAIRTPKDTTRDEVEQISKEVMNLYAKVIRKSQPAKKRPGQIRLALLAKMARVYISLLEIASTKEGDVAVILGRQIQELGITLSYLLTFHENDPDIYNKFARSSFNRMHRMIKYFEDPPEEFIGQEGIESAESLRTALLENGYDVDKEKLGPIPTSWHPEKSYYTMAKELGPKFEGMFLSFYSFASGSIHPDWMFLKSNELTYDNKNYAYADDNIHITPTPIIISSTCMMLDALEIYGKNASDKIFTQKEKLAFLAEVRELHFKLHNDGVPPKSNTYRYV